jgi:hypothetical protein
MAELNGKNKSVRFYHPFPERESYSQAKEESGSLFQTIQLDGLKYQIISVHHKEYLLSYSLDLVYWGYYPDI